MSFISGFTEIGGKVGGIFGSQGKALAILAGAAVGVGAFALARRYIKKRRRNRLCSHYYMLI